MAAFTPFFFRLYSADGESGIMYLANEAFRNDAYECAGARQIGTHKGKAVWYIAARNRGGYTDAMPEAAMFDRQNVAETEECHEAITPPNDKTTLYSDGKSYWFVDDSLLAKRGRSQSRSKKSAARSKSRKSHGR
jgi:hypothetical protein